MAKGVPTARSQRYKATHNAKDKIISTPFKSSNDALPLLTSISEKPTTQAAGAQLAFSTVQVLHQALLHAASPGTHPYALLQVMAPYISDCSERHRELELRNFTLQQQLDESNSKLLEQFNVQNAEILKLQEQLKKSQAAQEFYRQQAMHADLVPPRRRCRFVSPDADIDLSPTQIYQQLILARNDIQIRDRALERLQLQLTQLTTTVDQHFTSSAETLALHVTLLEQHLALHTKQFEDDSAMVHARSQLSACQAQITSAEAKFQQADAQLQSASAQYAQLKAQITSEDNIFRFVLAHHQGGPWTEDIYIHRPHLRPKPYHYH